MELQSTFNHRINNDPYVFSVTLYNGKDDTLKTQPVVPTSIKELVIEDSFYNFYHKGYIVIDNRFDAIERSVSLDNSLDSNIPTDVVDENNLAFGPGFIFSGDSRDYIDIKIMPAGGDNELLNDKAQRFLGIFIQGTIYAIEEVATESPDVKYKKLYFRRIHEASTN